MRVLIVTNMFPEQRQDISYYGIFVKEQMEAIAKYKAVEFDVFTIDGFKGKLEYLWSIPKILGKIKKQDYDLIHVHYGLSGIFLLVNPFKKLGKVVMTFHGGDLLPKQRKYLQVMLTRLAARRADRLIALNDEMYAIAKKIRHDSVVMPCGVDDTFFVGERNVSNKKIILFAGDPSRWVKNYPLFGAVVDCYKSTHAADDISVATLGGLDRGQVRDALLECSVLILTSHSEGSPQIIKEALSCDVPIISANVGDVENTLRGTPGTYVFPHGEEHELVASKIDSVIEEALRTPGQRRERLFALGLDNATVAGKIYDQYRCLFSHCSADD